MKAVEIISESLDPVTKDGPIAAVASNQHFLENTEIVVPAWMPPAANRELDEFNETGMAYDEGWNACRQAAIHAFANSHKQKFKLNKNDSNKVRRLTAQGR